MFNKHTGNGSFSKRRDVLSLEDTFTQSKDLGITADILRLSKNWKAPQKRSPRLLIIFFLHITLPAGNEIRCRDNFR